MVVLDFTRNGISTTALLEKPRRSLTYVVEVAPIIPRSDLVPGLLPFEQAVLHVSDILAQVQQLLQEDLDDLRLPLLTCLQRAQSDDERTDAELALRLFKQLLSRLPLQLAPLLECFGTCQHCGKSRDALVGVAHTHERTGAGVLFSERAPFRSHCFPLIHVQPLY